MGRVDPEFCCIRVLMPSCSESQCNAGTVPCCDLAWNGGVGQIDAEVSCFGEVVDVVRSIELVSFRLRSAFHATQVSTSLRMAFAALNGVTMLER